MSPTFRIAEKVLQAQAQHRPRVPRRPWARLPREAILDTSLSHVALRTLALLGLFANRQGLAFPSTKTISQALDISPATARRALRELGQRGYIASSTQPGSPIRRRYLSSRQPPTPETRSSMSGETRSSMSGRRSYVSGEALTDEREALTSERITIYRNDMHITKVDERCSPPAASDNSVEHRGGEAPPAPPHEARGEQGSPSFSPEALGVQGTQHPPPRLPLEKLEDAVVVVGALDPEEGADVPFPVRAKLAARLRATSLGLLRHLERVDGLLYVVSIAVLGWPQLPAEDEGMGWDEGEEPEERLRRWADEVTRRARFSFEELQAASEELYTLCSAVRSLLAAAAFICSQRPILTPGSSCAESIKRLAWEAAGEAERLTGIQPRESWSDACYLLADSLLTAQRVRRREGSIIVHLWRITPRLTPDELARRLPEAAAYIAATRRNGHGPHHEEG